MPNPIATFETSMGTMKASIYPASCASYCLKLHRSCKLWILHDGLHFHRVIPGYVCLSTQMSSARHFALHSSLAAALTFLCWLADRFMNQFGCPKSQHPKSSRAAGTGGPYGTFQEPRHQRLPRRLQRWQHQGREYLKDSNKLGMFANGKHGSRNSGGSQFFINVADNKNLDWFTVAVEESALGKFPSTRLPSTWPSRSSRQRTRDDNLVEPIKMIKVRVEMGEAGAAACHAAVVAAAPTAPPLGLEPDCH